MTKKTLILLGFILLKFLLQYNLFNPYYDLQRDEYLHLDQGNYLAWGYLSVPPVTSWISYIIQLLGNSLFWIRFFPALFGALTIVLVWKTIQELNGNLFALILGATCVLLSALLRLNLLFQPNSLDVLCWTTVCYFIIKYFNTRKTKWILLAAIAFAIGFLNKYNIIFLAVGFLPAILLTEQRKIFIEKNLYFSILVCLFLILPNLFWQYNNNFPVLHHLQILARTQLTHVDRWDFFKEQVLYFVGSLPVIIASLYALLFYKPFKKYRSFFWSFIFILAIFSYLRAKSYYAIGLYPIYISFGSAFLGNVLNTSWKKYLQPILIAIPVLFYILLFNVFYTVQVPEDILKKEKDYKKLGLLRWEDGKDHPLPQDFADMLGWKELAFKVDSVYLSLPDKERTLILCDNYGQAGAINFYTRQQIKAVSFNADYINWFDLSDKFENVIRVKEGQDIDTELEETSPLFQSSIPAASVTNKYARESGTTIFAFKGAKIDIREKIINEINEVKNYR
jgi:hypothetical protein